VKETRYSAKIEKAPFTFIELKKVSALALQGFSHAEIKEKAVRDNIFQATTDERKKELARMVLKRMKALDEYLLQQLVYGSVETGKLIVVYAIMKTDRLFFEFMNEVFKEKLIIRDYTLADKDFHIFFARKKEQSEQLAAWREYTFYKVKQVYIRVLFEAGLIKNKKSREIVKPLLEQSLIDNWLSRGDGMIVNILLGLN
jgi:hypothetical protein